MLKYKKAKPPTTTTTTTLEGLGVELEFLNLLASLASRSFGLWLEGLVARQRDVGPRALVKYAIRFDKYVPIERV
jgi:hypothetical protein